MVRPTIAKGDVRWTSKLALRTSVPLHWGEWRGGWLFLKDTRSSWWKNTLERPNRFIYSIPKNAKAWEWTLIARVLDQLKEGPVHVHLFSTPGSRDEYLGAWLLSEHRENVDRPRVSEWVLDRLEDQSHDEHARERSVVHRSANERVHEDVLRSLFPEYIVVHEPETILDLHEPTVVDGIARDTDDVSRSYTCDFVVCARTTCHRICVESKPSLAMVTDASLAKCRILRDRTLTRVLFIVGQGSDVRFLDLGPPFSDDDYKTYEDGEELKKALLG